MELSYYPGCSLHGTGVEYDLSTRAVCEALRIELREIEDWSCCGASSAHSAGGDLALALPARNLALAAEAGRDVVVPCAACFNRLRAAQLAVAPRVEVRSLVDLLASPEVLSRIADGVRRPLEGLSAVTYYGCLLVRPAEITGAEDVEDPRGMDSVLQALGIDLRTWSYKTHCCGGGLALPRRDVVGRLVGQIIDQARRCGADCIATACPMCLLNLEARQVEGHGRRDSLPVLYFTELVGLALGLEEAPSWLGRHLVDPRPLLRSRGLS